MDANYIINRLKSTVYKYPTAQLMKNRLRNLDDFQRKEIVTRLKTELHKQRNADIHEPLFELLYSYPLAS